MSEIAIFVYGLVVFTIVAVACWLIAWGLVAERRDREQLDAGPDARDPREARVSRPPGPPRVDDETVGASGAPSR